MGILQRLGGGTGYLKAGFLGNSGSGKSYTATKLAIGLRKFMKLEGPIAMFDTEGGSEYLAPMIRAETGEDLLGVRSRSLADLLEVTREAEAGAAAVLIVDSITHVWREVCDSYLAQVNAALAAKNKARKIRLEFQDWAAIKARWAEWPDLYLNSKLHVIVCGRLGYEWDMESRTDSAGREYKELVKTGVRMKAESEFGYEPSVLVEMEKIQVRDNEGKLSKQFVRRATVLKDRFDEIDGAQADDPDFEFFRPHVAMLEPGMYAPIDVTPKTDHGVDEAGEDTYQRERRLRVILAEKIQAALVKRWPGQTKEEKAAKIAAIEDAFGTTSWTEVETRLSSDELKSGLERIEATSKEAA